MSAQAATAQELDLHKKSNEAIARVMEKATHTVVITYSGFCNDSHATGESRTVHNTLPFKVVEFGDTNDLLNNLYAQLNRHDGIIYETLLSTGYDYTSKRLTLSVGDIVSIDCIRYIVCESGFACIDNAMVDVVARIREGK